MEEVEILEICFTNGEWLAKMWTLRPHGSNSYLTHRCNMLHVGEKIKVVTRESRLSRGYVTFAGMDPRTHHGLDLRTVSNSIERQFLSSHDWPINGHQMKFRWVQKQYHDGRDGMLSTNGVAGLNEMVVSVRSFRRGSNLKFQRSRSFGTCRKLGTTEQLLEVIQKWDFFIISEIVPKPSRIIHYLIDIRHLVQEIGKGYLTPNGLSYDKTKEMLARD